MKRDYHVRGAISEVAHPDDRRRFRDVQIKDMVHRIVDQILSDGMFSHRVEYDEYMRAEIHIVSITVVKEEKPQMARSPREPYSRVRDWDHGPVTEGFVVAKAPPAPPPPKVKLTKPKLEIEPGKWLKKGE